MGTATVGGGHQLPLQPFREVPACGGRTAWSRRGTHRTQSRGWGLSRPFGWDKFHDGWIRIQSKSSKIIDEMTSPPAALSSLPETGEWCPTLRFLLAV